MAPSTTDEDFELYRAVMIAQWEAEHVEDVAPIAETRVDVVEVLARVETGASTWGGRCVAVEQAIALAVGGAR